MKTKSILIVLFTLIATVTLSLIIFNMSQRVATSSHTSVSKQGMITEVSESNPAPQDKITVQLAVTKPDRPLAHGDILDLSVRVKNISNKEATYGFNSGCNSPDIYFNGENIYPVQGCTQAFTTVRIKPNETIVSDYAYTLIKDAGASGSLSMPYTDGDSQLRIEPGTYAVSARWQDVESQPINLIISK